MRILAAIIALGGIILLVGVLIYAAGPCASDSGGVKIGGMLVAGCK